MYDTCTSSTESFTTGFLRQKMKLNKSEVGLI